MYSLFPRRPPEPRSRNPLALAGLRASRAFEVPLDLYAKVIDPRLRLMQLLRDFDREFDTTFFEGKSYSDVSYSGRHLDEQLAHWNIPRGIIGDICRYCAERYWQRDDAFLATAG